MSASGDAGPPGADGSAPVVRAAGGVVWRHGTAGLEVLVVHRPRYDDWSLPKGKAEAGEDDLTCALREVEEEAGLRCRVGAPLGSVEYVDRRGRPKVVRYWAMEPVDGVFEPHGEVDEIRWVPVGEAGGLLTYGRDVDVVAAFAESHAAPPAPGTR